MKRAISTLSLTVLTLSILSAHAQLYWDGNGDAGGAGTTPTGTWGTDNFWNPDLNGGPSPGAWSPGSSAVFAAGSDATGTYTVTVNETQNVAGLTFEEGTVTLSGGTLDFPAGGNIEVLASQATINSVISGGAGALNLNPSSGGGTLVLGGASTFSDTLSVVFGTLRMGASGDILPTATVSLSSFTTLDLNNNSVGIGCLGGGTLSVNSSVILGSGTLTNLGMVPNNRYDGVISGNGSVGLVQAGTNILTLTGANTYQGRTMILGGAISLQSASDPLGTLPASPVADQLTMDNGRLHFPTTSPISIAAERGIYLGPNGGTITMASSKAPAFYCDITGPGALFKTSTGNMSLFGTNSFAGGLTIRAGGVRFNSNFAAGTGTIDVAPEAPLFLRILNIPERVSTVTNAMVVSPGVSYVDLNAAVQGGVPETIIFSGPISGTGPVLRGQQAGSSGYVVLSGDNSGWSGGLTLMRGKVGLGHKNALGSTALLIQPAPNTLSVNDAELLAWTPLTGANAVTTPVNINILASNGPTHFSISGTNALELAGQVDLGSDTTPIITVTNTGGTTFSGPVTGSVGLTKAGEDTLILSGTGSYSGATTVNAGTLLVNSPGSISSAVTVNSGGTLGGDGSISGAVTVSSGGSVGAGGSVGKLTLASTLDLSGGGTNVWELGALKDDSDGTAGTDFDQVAVSGTLTLGGSSTFKLVFHGTEPDSGNPFWQSTRSWTVISASSPAATFAAIENGVWAAGTFSTSAEVGGIVLTFTPSAAPQPVMTVTPGPGSDLTLNYSGGSGSQFVLLQTNNVAAPLSLWTRVLTNNSTPGSFIVTPGSDPQQFYRIQVE